MITITGGGDWHAAEFETEYVHDPDRSKHPARMLEYQALVRAICSSQLVGFCICVDMVAFNARFKGEPADAAYCKGFSDLLELLAKITRHWNTEAKANGNESVQVEFTFDRKQGEGTIVTLYDAFIGQPEWRSTGIFNSEVLFDTRRNPRAQIAELIAREGMKETERKITNRTPQQRGSRVALDACDRFRFIERDKDYWDFWAERVEDLRKKEGFSLKEYRQWLENTGRQANGLKERFEYLQWKDSKSLSAFTLQWEDMHKASTCGD